MLIVPNLNALRMFEAAARHQSFARAAEELCVTQSAVYKQIVALEERLGVRLFLRIRKRVLLTPQGSEYAGRVRTTLQRLQRDTSELVARGGWAHSIELAVPLSFGAELLIPKLQEFRKLRPEVQVHLSVRNRPFLFFDTPFDAAIVFGTRAWEGTTSIKLLEEGPMVPVCSPSLGRIRSAGDILKQPLLHLTSRLDDWSRWSAENLEAENPSALRGLRFDQFALLVSAAIAGMGIALVPRLLVERELASQRLVIAAKASLQLDRHLLLIRPMDREPSHALLELEKWLETAFAAPLVDATRTSRKSFG